MINKYYVIGLPVCHSLSPAIHTRLYERYGIKNCTYSSCNIAPDDLSNFICRIPEENIGGFNVTMPLKHKILPFLDYTDTSVTDGANTVVVRHGELFGYSTDAAGFFQSLHDQRIQCADKNIVFLGCGTVAKILIRSMIPNNPARITILNRTADKAKRLADGKLVFADSIQNIGLYMTECDLLIQTTPLGMEGTDQDFSDLSFLHQLNKTACVYDLIYHPARTRLLEQAALHGLNTINGLGMLIWQAFFAFEKFFGILPGREEYRSIEAALSQQL
jgi:shikimate dehydrogenase